MWSLIIEFRYSNSYRTNKTLSEYWTNTVVGCQGINSPSLCSRRAGTITLLLFLKKIQHRISCTSTSTKPPQNPPPPPTLVIFFSQMITETRGVGTCWLLKLRQLGTQGVHTTVHCFTAIVPIALQAEQAVVPSPLSFNMCLWPVLRIRDLGSGAFLTPGSGIRNRFFSGSRISDFGSRIPNPYYW